MATTYPGTLDSFTNPTSADTLDNPSHADQHANINDAMEAVQAELGTDPAGSYATVKARINRLEEPGIMRARRNTSDQSISNSTTTTLIFNDIVNEDDENADFSYNTATGEITIGNAGWYSVLAGIVWDTNTTGRRLLTINVNGSGYAVDSRTSVGNGNTRATVNLVHKFSASDVIKIEVHQDSGGTRTVLADLRTFLTIHRIR